MYEYKCKLERVIDGNTIEAEIDLGFNVLVRQRIRLYGIETASLQTPDAEIKQKGLLAKARLMEILPKEFVVNTVLNKRGKFGRTLGYVYIDSDTGRKCVNDMLVDEGIAEKYELNKE